MERTQISAGRAEHRPPAEAAHSGYRPRRQGVGVGPFGLVLGLLVTLATVPGAAAAATAPESAYSSTTIVATAAGLAPGMLDAMQRDLHLTPGQAVTRLAREEAASHTEQELRADLGAGFAGAWLTDDQRLMVAITDRRHAQRVQAQGGRPRLVTRSAWQLADLMTRLDRAPAPSAVTSWYVDTRSNTIVVETLPGGLAAARGFVQSAGVGAAAVRIETAASRLAPTYDVRGGDAITVASLGCSVGFSVVGGFVTAGHCGSTGNQVKGYNGRSMGIVAGSTFPGRDYAWVDVYSNWTPRPWVNNYHGSNRNVRGYTPAVVGASVCRSGNTTGWRCGTIKARNVTLTYDGGKVYGLTRTSACSDYGDSGGPFLSGTHAQGVTTAAPSGSGCKADTYFQPVRPILARYGLNLLVSGGAPGALPTIRSLSCESPNTTMTCLLSYVSKGSTQVRWKAGGVSQPAWNGKTVVYGPCTGRFLAVRATVSNSLGAWSATRVVRCGSRL